MAVTLILLAFLRTGSTAQGDSACRMAYGVQAHYGVILPHSESIRAVSHSNPVGIGFSASKYHLSPKDMEVFNAPWISGAEVSYFNFQNPEVLGAAVTITAFAEPLLYSWKKTYISLRSGTGLSWHSKVYDSLVNPSNLFFSSRISFQLFASLRLTGRINDRVSYFVAGTYNHISNGGYKQPNKGMNFPTLGIGLLYHPNPLPALGKKITPADRKNPEGFFVTLSGLTTLHVMEAGNGFPEKVLPVWGVQLHCSKYIRSKYALHAGAEMISDGYLREKMDRENVGTDHKRAAVLVGQEFIFGHVGFAQSLAYYVYSPHAAPDPVYQKYELSYRFCRQVSGGVYLKAHRHIAESMGLNLNYSFNFTKPVSGANPN